MRIIFILRNEAQKSAPPHLGGLCKVGVFYGAENYKRVNTGTPDSRWFGAFIAKEYVFNAVKMNSK
ncbi:hypothetical protein A6V30_07010 [Wohlfahrtiimonas chitiniclastica]|nr:hypothetical protein A6V30_07010 [Wohlfahrtiimonas chitiniclastica]